MATEITHINNQQTRWLRCASPAGLAGLRPVLVGLSGHTVNFFAPVTPDSYTTRVPPVYPVLLYACLWCKCFAPVTRATPISRAPSTDLRLQTVRIYIIVIIMIVQNS